MTTALIPEGQTEGQGQGLEHRAGEGAGKGGACPPHKLENGKYVYTRGDRITEGDLEIELDTPADPGDHPWGRQDPLDIQAQHSS